MIFPTNNNETLYPIWNTIVGGNSTPSTAGIGIGSYWYADPRSGAIDNNAITEYSNHGSCNYTVFSVVCGQNTGLYITLKNRSIIMAAFYFVASFESVLRDPLMITIEGSNLNGSALTYGSSWTLIYNGSSGLNVDPGRGLPGILQLVTNITIRYPSYRLLITTKRGSHPCTSYSEFVMMGY